MEVFITKSLTGESLSTIMTEASASVERFSDFEKVGGSWKTAYLIVDRRATIKKRLLEVARSIDYEVEGIGNAYRVTRETSRKLLQVSLEGELSSARRVQESFSGITPDTLSEMVDRVGATFVRVESYQREDGGLLVEGFLSRCPSEEEYRESLRDFVKYAESRVVAHVGRLKDLLEEQDSLKDELLLPEREEEEEEEEE